MLKLYDSRLSGNAYKVRLLLSSLAIPFERITLNLANGEARTPEMLARNPFGRIPILEFEDGRTLFESNAILFHLADNTEYLPREPWSRAKVLQWLMFEQYDLVRPLARPRFLISVLRQKEKFATHIAELQEMGCKALGHLDQQLSRSVFLVGDEYSIADMATYAYTHLAEEGEYELARYPAIRNWLARVERQPGYVPMLND
jgi:glutathione S-transferase